MMADFKKNTTLHVTQQYEWDCGIACAWMVAQCCGVQGVTYHDLCNAVGTKSIWTVEVAFVLAETCGLEVIFFTKLLGMNEELASDAFYAKEWDDDGKRLAELMPRAHQHPRLYMEQKTVSMEYIVQRLLEGDMVIVLVDKCVLQCEYCDGWVSRLMRLVTPGFVGHFVVLTGITDDKKRVVVMDPSQKHEACRVEISILEAARVAPATDQDIIFIAALNHNENNKNKT